MLVETQITRAPVKGKTFSQMVKYLTKPPIMQAANIARDDLRNDTISRGWKRFKTGIISEKVDDLSAKVFMSDALNATGPASLKQVASFLNFGTTAHMVKPVSVKALHWQGMTVSTKGLSAGMKKGDFFSKGHRVSGIKATGFWHLMDTSITKINKLINDWIAKR